ncbi:MAG TPA: type II toxin-antitoxin system HicB family antitoxin [Gemmataceae bacterium]|nr:type II toxin-antitoxin system HicB family antitoxin [Gemmataceae bacterium]
MKFAVVIEKAENNYSAYVPDLPGCISVGDTLAEVEQMIREAIEFHLEGMLLDGDSVPLPTTQCCYVDVDLPQVTPGGKAQEGRT